ncbi:hypothetical protein [Streptomyces sp. NBC_01789]|uniref:hypothetical protein n=1 Tax=Streptomyces sp. NBC_01789 TaxID=2975941 RepID=UPI0022586EAB|nr:hypothetical protein [Streptomyces sp. NBC_01789]MCX4450638.1 hypothetical protein [Streptomyces sp. NBC_01789]
MPERSHEHGTYYWEAGATECPHGPRPDPDTDGDAYDVWSDQHPTSDDVRICLNAPIGEACLDCSAEDGEYVPWAACRTREHALPTHGMVPNPDADHQQVTVWVGTLECLERECEQYFTDDGDHDPGVERCSHIREELACSCQRNQDGEYDGVCSASSKAAA